MKDIVIFLDGDGTLFHKDLLAGRKRQKLAPLVPFAWLTATDSGKDKLADARLAAQPEARAEAPSFLDDLVDELFGERVDDILDNCPVMARPGAQDLIDHFKKKGATVYCLTGGGVDYQTRALERAGLRLDGLFGAGSKEMPPVPKRWILVDDCPARDESAHYKIGKILDKPFWGVHSPGAQRILGRHYLQCEGFLGDRFGDPCSPLSDLIPRMERMLEIQLSAL